MQRLLGGRIDDRRHGSSAGGALGARGYRRMVGRKSVALMPPPQLDPAVEACARR